MFCSSNNSTDKILGCKSTGFPLVGNAHPVFFKVQENFVSFLLTASISGRQVGRRYAVCSRDKPVITYLPFFPYDGEHYPGACC